jgi:hypothetical protein
VLIAHAARDIAADVQVELGLGPNMLEPATFPLSTELGHRLRTVSHNLHKGLGFAVLRGLDPGKYSDEDNLIIYAGIVSWIGIERVTNPLGMSAGEYSMPSARFINLTLSSEHIRNALLDGKPADVAESDLEPAKQPHKMVRPRCALLSPRLTCEELPRRSLHGRHTCSLCT